MFTRDMVEHNDVIDLRDQVRAENSHALLWFKGRHGDIVQALPYDLKWPWISFVPGESRA